MVNYLNLVLLISLFSAPLVQANEIYFLGYHLPKPPVVGKGEYDQDFIELHRFQDHRTPEECAIANSQSQLSLENAFGPQTGILTAQELKAVKRLSYLLLARVGVVVGYFKVYFHRPRPYVTDTTLNPCINRPRNSDVAYPSGHSTAGYALALILAKKFPEKKDQILKQGLQIGENRLIGGVHHPSDVAAGRKLSEQIVKDFHF